MQPVYAFLQHWHLEVAAVLGFLLDWLLGDPESWHHPVRVIGGLTRELERRLYPKAGQSVAAFWNGMFLWLCVVAAVSGTTYLLTDVLGGQFFWAGFAFEVLLSYQLLAARCLTDSANRVGRALREEGLEAGRKAVSYIVGRDTASLSEAGVIRATVETVAENASDGEVAPLFYLLFFGVTGGWVYKAVNTMDSMLGYKNARYELFGRVAARMDDGFNWLPSRLAALLLVAAAALTGQDAKNAWRIFGRDRFQHDSPNAAQTESVVAGALGVQLAGPASYFGERKEKPYIGDAGRDIGLQDIARANHMLAVASWLSLLLFLALRLFCRAMAANLAVSLQSAAVLFPFLF